MGSESLHWKPEEAENCMRLVWTALICGALSWCGRGSAAAGPLVLHECRLEHPLRMSSIAARCGILAVPENPANPHGATIELHVAAVPALNRRSAGAPLFILAGGPGQAATDLYTSYASAFARVNRNHAIVLVDQRGTGRSAPLSCNYPDDWQADWRGAAEDMPQLRQATKACLAKFGDRVRYYTTSIAVGDLDKVRIALGYADIDLYGSSYGTRVAELYMRRYPQSTHAVVLDGVTYPEQVIGPDTPADGERALNLIVARCEHAHDCAAAYPDLRHDLKGLRQRFGPEQQTLTVSDPSSGVPLQIEFNRNMLNAALRFLSYNSSEASLLPTLLHQAAIGNLAPLASQTIMMSRQIDQQLASGMQNSVICSEDEPLFTASKVDRQRLAQTYQGSDQLDALAEICKIWPRGPVDPDLHSALRSDVPTLLLSGEADPVTPPDDAVRAAQQLQHHRNLVLDGEGHGQVATACVPKLMAEFFENPVAETLDAGCLTRHRPAPFFVGLTGPSP
jgi:pimeloyl-ACP methyl ester carboxylesterase